MGVPATAYRDHLHSFFLGGIKARGYISTGRQGQQFNCPCTQLMVCRPQRAGATCTVSMLFVALSHSPKVQWLVGWSTQPEGTALCTQAGMHMCNLPSGAERWKSDGIRVRRTFSLHTLTAREMPHLFFSIAFLWPNLLPHGEARTPGVKGAKPTTILQGDNLFTTISSVTN